MSVQKYQIKVKNRTLMNKMNIKFKLETTTPRGRRKEVENNRDLFRSEYGIEQNIKNRNDKGIRRIKIT
jgi:hypothetical protein